MNQKTSKVEKEFYLRCSYLTLSVLFDKEPNYSKISLYQHHLTKSLILSLLLLNLFYHSEELVVVP